jgi:carboxypeptidase family protein
MTRLALLIALCVSLSACGGDATPTSPGTTSPTPSPTAFTLSGTVFGDGRALGGASVTIMDGVHAGQARDTDHAGNYSFMDLTPSSFTLQAAQTTDGYLTQNAAVNLTANQSVNFLLTSH